MTKNCYFGGFLYHPDSQKILLQENRLEDQLSWSLLGDFEERGFQKVIAKVLGLKLHPQEFLPIYDYIAKKKHYFIFYVEVKNLSDFPAKKNYSFKWFTTKEISKLPLPNLTKQDITVGRRVIDSQIRRNAGERFIE